MADKEASIEPIVMVLELETVPPALLKPVKEDIRPVGRDRLDDIVQVETQVWG